MALRLAPRPGDRDRIDDDPDESHLSGKSLLRFLDEFRRRIVYCATAVAVGVVVTFAFINQIFEFVFRPIRSVLPPGSKMIYTQPGEAFSIFVQIALMAGVIVAAPFVMYQVWRLIAPALYLKQKKLVIPFVLMTTAGFVAGALFNHYIVFRWMMVFFSSFNSPGLTFMPRLDDVFGLYMKMLFGMAIVFQMPTMVYFLAKMGLVTARFLIGHLKYAILIIFIAAATITPTGDMTTQTLFALPMIGLYLISIVIAWIVGPAARRTSDQ